MLIIIISLLCTTILNSRVGLTLFMLYFMYIHITEILFYVGRTLFGPYVMLDGRSLGPISWEAHVSCGLFHGVHTLFMACFMLDTRYLDMISC